MHPPMPARMLRVVARRLCPPATPRSVLVCTEPAATLPGGSTDDIIPAADKAQFMREGFIVLHEYLAAPQLAEVREAVEAGIGAERWTEALVITSAGVLIRQPQNSRSSCDHTSLYAHACAC